MVHVYRVSSQNTRLWFSVHIHVCPFPSESCDKTWYTCTRVPMVSTYIRTRVRTRLRTRVPYHMVLEYHGTRVPKWYHGTYSSTMVHVYHGTMVRTREHYLKNDYAIPWYTCTRYGTIYGTRVPMVPMVHVYHIPFGTRVRTMVLEYRYGPVMVRTPTVYHSVYSLAS